ncbi:MAG: sigma-70 family RNA polymerase sigma factor [Pseudomonadota bacterium]
MIKDVDQSDYNGKVLRRFGGKWAPAVVSEPVHQNQGDISSSNIESPRPKADAGKTEQMPDAVADLYMEYAETLTSALRTVYGDGPPAPEDIAQQSFYKLIERGNLDTIGNLKAFVWRTARNLVLAAKRSSKVRSSYDYEVEQIYFPLKGDISTPESIIEAKEQLRAVNELLLKMPEKRRRALMLHRVEGLSIAAVGRRLGISRSTAAQHVVRAAADLDLMLLKSGDD